MIISWFFKKCWEMIVLSFKVIYFIMILPFVIIASLFGIDLKK